MTKKQKVKLAPEEQATLDAFEKAFSEGKIKSIPHVAEEIERFKIIAQASANKAKRVSLRMTEWDFNKAQVAALREGMPYQTLLASVIHKYLTGQLVSKHEHKSS
jgi:predicted DNA binding CopG/RHH family protein